MFRLKRAYPDIFSQRTSKNTHVFPKGPPALPGFPDPTPLKKDPIVITLKLNKDSRTNAGRRNERLPRKPRGWQEVADNDPSPIDPSSYQVREKGQ